MFAGRVQNSLIFSRLAQAQLFTWGYFFYHFFSMTTMRILLNNIDFFENLSFWIQILALEHLLIFAIYGLFNKAKTSQTIQLVVISALLIGMVRTFLTTGLAELANIGTNVPWTFQLVSGAVFELFMVLVWANVNGAYRDHRQLVGELNSTRNQILGYRENAEVLLADEQYRLHAKTQESLLPQIQMIEKALISGQEGHSNGLGVAQEIRALINNQVRPLSEDLRKAAKDLVQPAPKGSNPISWLFRIPSTFQISNSIFPGYTYFILLLTFIATPFWTTGSEWVPFSVGLSLTYYLVLHFIKRSTLNWPAINAWFGVPTLFLISLLAIAPSVVMTLIFYPNHRNAELYGWSLFWASTIVFMSIAYLDALDYSSRVFRTNLDEEIQKLSFEMALFEQQVWVFRRNWSIVIHGTVQASLTAALTRLNSTSVDSTTFELAQRDLERAKSALAAAPKFDTKFDVALSELISTWQGVCEISVELNPKAKKLLNQDSKLSMCVNEIMKEAISNAVRHGDAQHATAFLELNQDDFIDLLISNDGTAPSKKNTKGIGSRLLDELTMDWNLGFDSKSGQTILTARLPFLKPQA